MRHARLLIACCLSLSAASVRGADSATWWQAPDRGAKVAQLVPGIQVRGLTRNNLFAKWTTAQVEKWNREHPAQSPQDAYAAYAETAPTDADLAADFPTHISPYGRVLSGSPEARKADQVMITYCPFCGAWYDYYDRFFYDWDGRYHAATKCCKKQLYAREQDFPAGYDLGYEATGKFQHLDDTVKEIRAATYTDKDGVVWQLFIPNIFSHRRWEQMNSQVLTYCNAFKLSGDPVCVHKIAVILDMTADTYYGLPLAYDNTQAHGKDGKPLTRAEWEAVPRPSVFEPSYLGAWNRRGPTHSRGWLHNGELAYWVEPFARVRHHPTFKYYSEKKYGDPDALDRKITAKLLREVGMMLKSCYAQRLQTNYQEAMYPDMMLLGLLLQDEFLFDFAAANQECTLYNHHHQDGLNQQGAPNYMDMLNGFYAYLKDPQGWLQFDPGFLDEHPFLATASTELTRLRTVRGLQLEFGDEHIWPFQSLVTDPVQIGENENLPSMNWPGYGVGILRVGGPGHRQEVVLSYDKVSLHGAANKLGIACWVDGVPVMRPGGYAYHYHATMLDRSRPEIQAFYDLPYPKDTEIVQAHTDPQGWCWTYGHSPLAQNTVTVDDTGTSPGWSDNEGFGELLTFKGGEQAGRPGARFQVLDVRDHDSFDRVGVKVSEFRRTLLAVEGPDGRPYVVDIVRLQGGQTHTLYQSAWAQRAEDTLPPVVSTPRTLAQAFFSDDPARAEALIPGGKDALAAVYEKIRKVERLDKPPATWDLNWKTDYARYAPREPDGKPFARPLPDDVGLVRLRLIGLSDPGDTELVRARAPWFPWIKQPLPNGAMVHGYVAFMDAVDLLIERRSRNQGGPEATLASNFLHVLEGFREHETSAITKVERLTPAAGPDTAVVLRLEFAAGHNDTVIFQPQPATLQLADGLATDAQYALLRRSAAGVVLEAHIVRGTHLNCGAFAVCSPGDLTGTIVDLIGDLTGTRQESALIVRADGPWPVGASLARRQIIIEATNSVRAASNEGYVIQSVTELPAGLLRVNLANHPPFAAGWLQVVQLPAHGARRNTFRTNRPFLAGANTPWSQGLRVWFPKIGKTCTFKRTEPANGVSGGTLIELVEDVDLADAGVTLGDWCIVHAVEPGMRVNVAAELAWGP